MERCAVLRIVLLTVPRASRSCEIFPDVFDVHHLRERGEHFAAEMWVGRVGGQMRNSDPSTTYTYTATDPGTTYTYIATVDYNDDAHYRGTWL